MILRELLRRKGSKVIAGSPDEEIQVAVKRMMDYGFLRRMRDSNPQGR